MQSARIVPLRNDKTNLQQPQFSFSFDTRSDCYGKYSTRLAGGTRGSFAFRTPIFGRRFPDVLGSLSMVFRFRSIWALSGQDGNAGARNERLRSARTASTRWSSSCGGCPAEDELAAPLLIGADVDAARGEGKAVSASKKTHLFLPSDMPLAQISTNVLFASHVSVEEISRILIHPMKSCSAKPLTTRGRSA